MAEQGLKKALKTSDLTVFGMMFMIPIAPMAWYGTLVGPALGMVSLGYLIALVAMLFTGIAYGEMAKKFPFGGSVYRYVQQSTNPTLGFLAGWGMMLAYFFMPAVCYCVGAMFASFLFPNVPLIAWYVIFTVLTSLAAWLGIEASTRVSWILFFIEVGLIVWFFIAVIVKLAQGEISVNTNSFVNPNVEFSLSAVLNATVVVVLSYVGFDAISTLAEETIEPTVMVPRATIISIIAMGSLFAIIVWLAGWVLPDYTVLPEDENMFVEIFAMAGGRPLQLAGSLILIMAFGLACGLESMVSTTRILYAMGQDGVIPKVMGTLNSHQVPGVAIIFMAIVSIVQCAVFGLGIIAQVTSFGSIIGFMAVDLSVVWKLFIHGEPGEKKVFGHLIAPLLGFLICLFIFINSDPFTLKFGGVWMIIGVIWLVVITRFFTRPTPALDLG